MRVSVDNSAHIKNTYEIVEIDSRPDYSLSSRNLKWRSRSVAKSTYQFYSEHGTVEQKFDEPLYDKSSV